MSGAASRSALERLLRDFLVGGPGLPRIWGRRAFWQVRFRWIVPPVIVAAVLIGHRFGFDFPALPIYCVAAGIFFYNIAFAVIFARRAAEFDGNPRLDRLFTILQVGIDYSAMFVLIAATGGAVSPLIFFFVFHVVLAAIQFRPATAFLFATMATGGLWILTGLQIAGLMPHAYISYRGTAFNYMDWPAQMLVILSFFTASVLISALIATRVMAGLRRRIHGLADATRRVSRLGERQERLNVMLKAIGAEQRLAPILETVTSQVAASLDLPVVAVKLLSEDGRTLTFKAAYGLPEEFIQTGVVQLAESPLNRKVIEGETFVLSRVDQDGDFKLHPDMIKRGIRSVAFAPLTLEGRVIGILGAYALDEDHFDSEEEDYLRLAAELVAVAIENARGYEAIRALMEEHTKFMMQVAHNMRAPLGASLSMLELLEGGYLGETSDQQREYVRRVSDRIESLHETIGALLVIGRTRDRSRNIIDVMVDLPGLARQIEETFREEAAAKGLRFAVKVDEGVGGVASGANLIEQLLENLVSNAVKYTPSGGVVALELDRDGDDTVRIRVTDTGIGIPAAEQEQLGREFFRASNAKELKAVGTGLGLAFVRRAVERHDGRMRVESEEGRGTCVTVHLPVGELPAEPGVEAEDPTGHGKAARRDAGRPS